MTGASLVPPTAVHVHPPQPPTGRLAELEQVIEQGLGTFIEVGAALMEIRDSGLYKESFPTFADYCRTRWNFGRSRAYQLIDAAKMSTVVDIKTERQARELAKLPLEEVKTISSTVDFSRATAKDVREAVKDLSADDLYAYVLDTPRKRQLAEATKSRMISAISTMRGLCQGLPTLDLRKIRAASDQAELDQWADEVDALRGALRDFAAELRGRRSA